MAAPTSEARTELSRIVGWINRREWQTVFHKIYSDDTESQQNALGRISAWKSRFGDQMPVSIECTASLVRAQLLDNDGGKADAAQMAYSIAIIRFVNLITGRQQKGATSKPVSFLAEKVGLPSWMVDLRHEAAHRVLPSLSILREGANRALAWLQREYWESQSKKGHLEEEPEGSQDDTSTRDAVSECLIQYQQEQFQIMQPSKKKNKKKKRKNSREPDKKDMAESLTAESSESLADLEELLLANQNARHIIPSILILDGYLVPTDEQLTSLNITNKGYWKNPNHLPTLDTKIISLWTPLLRLLHSLNITPLLLATLLKELTKFSLPGNEAAEFLLGWAVLISTEAGRHSPPGASSGSKRGVSPHSNEGSARLLYEGSKANKHPWNDLAKICIENPNTYTIAVLSKILKHMTPKPNPEMLNKITRLCAIFNKPFANMAEFRQETQENKKKGNKSRKISTDKEDDDQKMDTNESKGNDNLETPVDSGLETPLATGLETPLATGLETPLAAGLKTPHDSSNLANVETEVNSSQLLPMHTIDELISLLKKKRENMQGVIGIQTQSAKDARLLRKRKSTVWTKCKGNINWADYPLGMLPGQPTDPDYFLLNIHETKKPKRSCDEEGVAQNRNPPMTTRKSPHTYQGTEKLDTPNRKPDCYDDENQEEASSSLPNVMSIITEREIPISGDSPGSYDEQGQGDDMPELMGVNQGADKANMITLF